MTRKTNPEKDAILPSASAAAAARPRRVTTTRTARTAKPAQTSTAGQPETTARVDSFVTDRELSRDEIARLAYSLWEARGRQGGTPEEDWLRAEEELRQRAFAPAS